jgi:hypothetical protein
MDSAEKGDYLGTYPKEEVSKMIDLAIIYGYNIVERKHEKNGEISLWGKRTSATSQEFPDSPIRRLEKAVA